MIAGREHLASLDVFRGATIAAMILVNNPGDWSTVFPLLQHADWNGLTAADVVFPFFVFIMGCAMPFAFARRHAEATGPGRLGTRVWRRTVALVALGLVLNLVAALPHVGGLRIPGVLQRLGITYLLTALIVRSCGAVAQGVIAFALMAAHWAAMTVVPFGGHVATAVSKDHNLAGYVDARVFGSHTLMPGFDPEGLLGTAPTVATALIGSFAGQWLRRHADHGRQAAGLAGGGAAMIALGLAWTLVWPINKPLWSGSYVLVSSGLAAVTLATLVYVVDARGIRQWGRPFLWLGVNPLAIYFCSELVGHLMERPVLATALSPKDSIYWRALVPLTGNRAGEWTSLLFAIGFVCCWIWASAILYRRGIRIGV